MTALVADLILMSTRSAILKPGNAESVQNCTAGSAFAFPAHLPYMPPDFAMGGLRISRLEVNFAGMDGALFFTRFID